MKIISIIFCIIFGIVSSKYVYVDVENGKLICSGTVNSQCKTIAEGLSFAESGDSLLISPGLYTGNGNENLNRSASAIGVQNISLIGVSEAANIFCSDSFGFLRSDDYYITVVRNIAVINCTIYDDIVISRGGALKLSNNPMNISNSLFSKCGATIGGTIYTSGSNLMIENTIFSENYATAFGGAIFSNNGELTISGCSFTRNKVLSASFTVPNADESIEDTAGRGGAIAITNGESTSITNTTFVKNTAHISGGAVHCGYSSSIDVVNATFIDNQVSGSGSCGRNNACEVRGGAIYTTHTRTAVANCVFDGNMALTSSLNDFAGGGAIYIGTTSVANIAIISNSSFRANAAFGTMNNDAGGSGGALFVATIDAIIYNCVFEQNFVMSDGLFTEFSSNGGAVAISGSPTCDISLCLFDGNFVVGGSGGAMYITDLAGVTLSNNTFNNNSASSTYVYKSQGGAVAVFHGSTITVLGTNFYFNVVFPQITSDPRSYSGTGGGMFVQSSSMNMSRCLFFGNTALTGQFDSGGAGGGLAVEDCSDITLQGTSFSENSAKGYSGFSSYTSSGTGGALAVLFSTIVLKKCQFGYNWVTAGGSEFSLGGAISIFYEYLDTSSDYDNILPIRIIDSIFVANLASGEACTPTQIYRAGQGGAIFAIGVSSIGLVIENTQFIQNIALTGSDGIVNSYGGAIAYTQGSRITCSNCQFMKNIAWNGLGNDVATAYDATDDVMSIYLLNPQFTSASDREANAILIRVLKRIIDVCETKSNSVRVLGKTNFDFSLDPLSLTESDEDVAAYQNQRYATPRKTRGGNHKYSRASIVETSDVNYMLEEASGVNENPFKKLIFPSVLITVGNCSIYKPVFNNSNEVFIGNFVSLLIKRDYGDDSLITLNPANFVMEGSADASNLQIYAFQGNVSILDPFVNESIVIKSLCIIDSNLRFENNITIISPSYILASFVESIIPQTFDYNNKSYARPALLNFQSKISTGIKKTADDTVINLLIDGVASAIGSVSRLRNCELHVFGEMLLSATVSPGNGTIILEDGAVIVVEEGGSLTVATNMALLSPHVELDTYLALVNDGTVNIGDVGEISAGVTLRIEGIFSQGASGVLNVKLSNSGSTVPLVSTLTNASMFGILNISITGDTDLVLYSDEPSNWTIINYRKLRNAPPLGSMLILSPPGLLFDTSYSSESSTAIASTRRYPSSPFDVKYSQNVVIEDISCPAMLQYYKMEASTSDYRCYICLQNSSCTYCEGSSSDTSTSTGSCVSGGSGRCGGEKHYSNGNCCKNACNGRGYCDANDQNTAFSCDCNFWYQGDDCNELSLSANILIACAVFSFVLLVVTAGYYYYYRQQNKKVLEELRLGLLDVGGNSSSATGDFVPKTYLQSIQQDLILRDVFVPYEEIKMEGKIGEGSFGVVFKGTFRGAQVAVKQMRSPVYMQLSDNDIEEFRKEAYMMSRLRHPNIVLVMGVSLVEIEQPPIPDDDEDVVPSKFARKISNSTDNAGASNDRGVLAKDNNAKKKKFVKSVCILTEFLEQGSLADILYGSNKLPPEVWTYELVLTCALQAARGMLYLHSHQPPICHRDLKSSNLVVDDHWVVKVTDFGMSRIVPKKIQDIEKGVLDAAALSKQSSANQSQSNASAAGGVSFAATPVVIGGDREEDEEDEDGDTRDSMNNDDGSGWERESFIEKVEERAGGTYNHEMTSNLGTTAWCAPEILTATTKTRYSVKVDVYSFGMVLWELIERKRPYEELYSRFDIIDAVREGRRPIIGSTCPPAYRSLIQRCWHQQPARRPTFQYIVRYIKDELAHMKRLRLANSSGGGNGSTISPLMSMLRGGSSSRNSVHTNSSEPRGGSTSSDYLLMTESQSSQQTNNTSIREHPAPASAPPAGRPPRVSNITQEKLEDLSQSPRAGPATGILGKSGAWRDRYVMKLNGWSFNEPDKQLPPALSGAPTSAAFPRSNSIQSSSDVSRADDISSPSEPRSGSSDAGDFRTDSAIANSALEDRSQKSGLGYELDVIPPNDSRGEEKRLGGVSDV